MPKHSHYISSDSLIGLGLKLSADLGFDALDLPSDVLLVFAKEWSLPVVGLCGKIFTPTILYSDFGPLPSCPKCIKINDVIRPAYIMPDRNSDA